MTSDYDELRHMVDDARTDLPTKAYYNKCDEIKDTKFCWAGMIKVDDLDGWFSMPEDARVDYAMWFVATAAESSGVRWQDACNELVLSQHGMIDGRSPVASMPFDPDGGDAEILGEIVGHLDSFSSPIMLELTYVIASSGFDPSDAKAVERLESMGILKELTMEDNAKLDFYEDNLIIEMSKIYVLILFDEDEDSEAFKNMVFIMANFIKIDADDSIERFKDFKAAVDKSKSLRLEGDLGYDRLLELAGKNRAYHVSLDDKTFYGEVNAWADGVNRSDQS